MGDHASPDGRRRRRGPELHLLGSFAVSIDDGRVEMPVVAQRLAALLAVRGEPIPRLRAGTTLWPDADDGHAQANVRTALWRLRIASHRLVTAGGECLRLADDVAVDLWEARRLARTALHEELTADGIVAARDQLSVDLLPDWDEDWLLFERERFRELRVHALEALCERLTAAGAHAEAIECGLLAVEAEPLRESAHRALVRAHLAEGNRAQAARQYRLLTTVLRDELQVPPSVETLELATRLLTPA